MKSDVPWSGRILLAAVVTAGAAVAAPKSATVVTGTSGAASAVTPKKMDARQIEELVQQGVEALAARDAKLARDLFLDATQADSRNARALHGLALAYYALGDVQKAAASVDRAVSVPGALDHALAYNAGAIHLAAKSPMRAAKIAKDYLTAKPNPVNEPVANIILVALDRADAQARRNAFYTEVRNFYAAYVKRMEAANPGYMRFGSQWLPAETVQEYNRINAVQQPIYDRTSKELADLEAKLAVRREQLAVVTQQIERGQIGRWADNDLQREVADLQRQRDEKKRILDETAAKMAKLPPLPDLSRTVAMDSPIPPLSQPVEVAAAHPVPAPQPEVTDPQTNTTDGQPARRSRRFRRPPGDDGPTPEQPQPAQPTPPSLPQPAEPAAPATPPTPQPVPPADVPSAVDTPAPQPAPKRKVRLTAYAAAFPVAPDLLITTAAAVDGATQITLQSRDGNTMAAQVVRTDAATGLALIRVAGAKLAHLELGAPAAGPITCAAFADANIFAPTAEMLSGTAPAPAAGWSIRFTRHPRLAGAPLVQNGKVVGVAIGDRDSDKSAYPAVPVDAIKAILREDAPGAAGQVNDPLLVLMQVSATKEREQ